MCVSVTFWGFVRNFEDETGGFEKSAKTTHTPPRVPFQTDQSTGCCRSFCCRKWCDQYYRHRLTTRASWLVPHAWGLMHVWWPMTYRRWRLTDGRCTPAYSSSWNTLRALKLNQMSTTLHSNTYTTPRTSVVYTSNKNTQCIRLDDNSFGNTRSLVENSVISIDLRWCEIPT